RNRSHWNISNIQPRDPVLLGICSQTDLEEHLVKARKRRPEAVAPPPPPPAEPELKTKPENALDAETLFKTSDAVA
ncbi:MAG TPA: cell cycle transcriptional regulator TrcR, partial [Alphaproteobacteria bacterium]|nr:cell cycle transcriptional regulator TrcR [Alphaproteobacteria bacterium]